jgi:hypothetical protein
MNERMHNGWILASAIWMLVMIGMSFDDLVYGAKYYIFHGRVMAAHQEKLAAHERNLQEIDAHIAQLLPAAKQYHALQFRSLQLKRISRPARSMAHATDAADAPRSEYERVLMEIAALEKTYGQTQLRSLREPTSERVQQLRDDMQARLVAPQLRAPRLGAVLFHMLATPLALLLALWVFRDGYRTLPWLSRYFGAKSR